MIATGTVTAVHDISGGGVLVALARMALASNIGASLEAGALTTAAAAFGEGQGRYLVTTKDGAAPAGAQRIGTTGGPSLAGVSLADLRAANEGALPAALKGEL